MERTLAFLKPDGMRMKLIEKVRQFYVDAGLTVVEEYEGQLDEHRVSNFYYKHDGRFYFDGLVLSIADRPIHAFILEGEDAIERVRELNGDTVPSQAAPGTLRSIYRSAGGPFNTIHGSDGADAFFYEYDIIKKFLNRVA
jgi:nucleoside-diphosphate kinase